MITVIKTICKLCYEVGKCTSKKFTSIYRDIWRQSNEQNTSSSKVNFFFFFRLPRR